MDNIDKKLVDLERLVKEFEDRSITPGRAYRPPLNPGEVESAPGETAEAQYMNTWLRRAAHRGETRLVRRLGWQQEEQP